MRNRKPKKNRAAKKQSFIESVQSFSPVSLPVNEPQTEITEDEARVLGFIRRDVVWSVSVLATIVIGFVVISKTIAHNAQWAPFAEKMARTAGLIR